MKSVLLKSSWYETIKTLNLLNDSFYPLTISTHVTHTGLCPVYTSSNNVKLFFTNLISILSSWLWAAFTSMNKSHPWKFDLGWSWTYTFRSHLPNPVFHTEGTTYLHWTVTESSNERPVVPTPHQTRWWWSDLPTSTHTAASLPIFKKLSKTWTPNNWKKRTTKTPALQSVPSFLFFVP